MKASHAIPGHWQVTAEAHDAQKAVGRGDIHLDHWKVCLCVIALGWSGHACAAAPTAPTAPTAPATTPMSTPSSVTLSCAVAYTPQRSTWVREVRIEWDKKAIRRLRIDGLEPYGFSLLPNGFMTAIDNERIQIDLKAQAWTSDFRGLAAGLGRCETVPG